MGSKEKEGAEMMAQSKSKSKKKKEHSKRPPAAAKRPEEVEPAPKRQRVEPVAKQAVSQSREGAHMCFDVVTYVSAYIC
jgi:hypothetical protein